MLQVNATLTAIKTSTAAKGRRDDWDNPGVEPAGAGAVKWTGYAEAYYTQKLQQVQTGNGPSIAFVGVLYIESGLAATLGLDTDDLIEWTDAQGAGHVDEAANIAIRQLSSIPSDLQTTRIELSPR